MLKLGYFLSALVLFEQYYRGQLTSLKLSPNLRNLPRDPKGAIIDGEQRTKFEVGKMTKLLSLVRDPETVTGPKATLTSSDQKQAMSVLSIMSTASAKK